MLRQIDVMCDKDPGQAGNYTRIGYPHIHNASLLDRVGLMLPGAKELELLIVDLIA